MTSVTVNTTKPPYVYAGYAEAFLSPSASNLTLVAAQETIYKFNSGTTASMASTNFSKTQTGCPNSDTSYYFNTQRQVWYSITDAASIAAITSGSNTATAANTLAGQMAVVAPLAPWMLTSQCGPSDRTTKAGADPVSAGQAPANANIEIVWGRYATGLTYSQSWWNTYRANNYAADNTKTTQQVWDFSETAWF